MEEKENLSKLKLKQVERSFPTTKPDKNIVPISCPSCDASPAIENINIHDKIAKCESCSTVYSFEQEVKQLEQTNEKIVDENIARPAGIEKSYFHDDLELTMQQPTGGLWISLVVGFVFFVGLLYFVHLEEGISMLWSIGMGVLGILSLYKYWNRTNEKIYTIVDDEYLTIQYRPKNFVKDKLIATREIEQLYVKTITTNYYSLYAITNSREGQKHVRLIQYIDSRNKARYLEREIEMYLGIEDRRLEEE